MHHPPTLNLPAGLIQLVEAAGDRLENKAAQLIQHQTMNLSESYMSVRSKLDGGKFYNLIPFICWSVEGKISYKLD